MISAPDLDAATLVHDDPSDLVPRLGRVTGDEDRLLASVYLTSTARHRTADAATRRHLLMLDAARWGADDLYRSLATLPGLPAPDVTVSWATGGRLDDRQLMRLPGRGPQAVAEIDGRPVVVTAETWTLHVHDLATGANLRSASVQPDGYRYQESTAVAVAEVDGRWIAVVATSCPGCDDHDTCEGELRRWDLADGTAFGPPLPAHRQAARAVAVTTVDGRQVMLSGGNDGALRMWDPRTGTPIGAAVVGHRLQEEWSQGVVSISVGDVDGRRLVFTGGCDGAIRIWDLAADGVTPGRVLLPFGTFGYNDAPTTLALGALDGTPVLVAAHGDVSVWNLRTDERLQLWENDTVFYITLQDLAGQPTVVAATNDFRIRTSNLRDGDEIDSVPVGEAYPVGLITTHRQGRPVAVVATSEATTVVALGTPSGSAVASRRPGHRLKVEALAVTEGPAPVVVAGGRGDIATVRGLRDGYPVGAPLAGHRVHAASVATAEVAGLPVVVTSDTKTLRVWDRTTGALVRAISMSEAGGWQQVRYSASGLAVAYPDGRAVAVTGDNDRRILAWDLESGRRADHPPITGTGEYPEPVVAGHRLVLARDGSSVRVWDLVRGEQVRSLDHEHPVSALATVGTLAVTSTYGTIHVWDVTTGELTRTFDLKGRSNIAAAEVAGHLVVAGTLGDVVHTWDVTADRAYLSPLVFPDDVAAVAVTGEGALVVAFGSDLALVRPTA